MSASKDGQHSRIQLDRLMAVHYQHTKLDNIHAFLSDFGLIEAERRTNKEIYYRGFGPETVCYLATESPDDQKHFIGGIFAVQSADDLVLASQVPGASGIEPCTAPCGGHQVTLTDPVGTKVTLIHGAKLRALDAVVESAPPELQMNYGLTKPRTTCHSFERGPTKVAKCGHYGVRVDTSRFDETEKWYVELFNLELSSCLLDSTGRPLFRFLHIDKGKEFVDHHSFFICRAMRPMTGVTPHHSSFESDNFDTQQIGHDWLLKKGWTSCYGMGRHKYGSHIFDYWFDASGNIIEHYTDGDLVNCDSEPTFEEVQADSIKVWGPSIPVAFFSGRPEDAVHPSSQRGLPGLTSLDHGIRDGLHPNASPPAVRAGAVSVSGG